MHKRERFFLIFIIFVAALLQATIFNYLRIASVKPNLLLALVIYTALYAGERFSFSVGLYAGILEDIFSAGIFGVNALLFAVCAMLLSRYSTKIYREELSLQVILSFFITFIVLNLYYFLLAFHFKLPDYFLSFKIIILPVSLYTTACFYLISYFLPSKIKESLKCG
jgi:rod shape-determining protein MreD